MIWQYRVVAVLAIALLTACPSATPDPTPVETPEQAEEIHLRLLAFNDFHGALEGPTGSVMVGGERLETGGAEYFAAWLAEERSEVDNVVTVAAGDLIGATPLISALFRDEPTIEIMDAVGLDISSVGNHEFDAGVEELMRIVEGGCHADGCREGYEYGGAQFTYLAANVRWRESGETILPAYEIREFDGLKVAFIGMTLENTPSVVVPSAVESVSFHNEVETVNALVPGLQEKGVHSIVVLLHDGGRGTIDQNDISECPGVQGNIVPIAEGLDPMVSVIVSGHSHQPHICEFSGKLVTQAGSSGRMFTVIDLRFDGETKTLLGREARQRPVTRDIEPHQGVLELVATYREIAEPLANRAVAQITGDFIRGHRAEAGNSAMGQLIADSQLAASAEEAGAQIAFMNPGGIRSSLRYSSEGQEREDGIVTYADLHIVQPFGNVLITMTLTGAEIHQLLEQQWADENRANIMAVSRGFSYTWDPAAERGSRVIAESITLHGEPLDMEAEYRVTVNNFMADGGDGFVVLREGRNRTGGVVDLDAIVTYMSANSPLEPVVEARIITKE